MKAIAKGLIVAALVLVANRVSAQSNDPLTREEAIMLVAGLYVQQRACEHCLAKRELEVLNERQKQQQKDQEAARQRQIVEDKQKEIAIAKERQENQNLANLGYNTMTIKDFVLDGKELAGRSAKVAVSGFIGVAGGSYLHLFNHPSGPATHDLRLAIPLLTEGASREASPQGGPWPSAEELYDRWRWRRAEANSEALRAAGLLT
jgi:hypothetical protein